jgi:hypothetical protein
MSQAEHDRDRMREQALSLYLEKLSTPEVLKLAHRLADELHGRLILESPTMPTYSFSLRKTLSEFRAECRKALWR